jgi:hypothetical protein
VLELTGSHGSPLTWLGKYEPDAIQRVLRAINARYRARRSPWEVPELGGAGSGGWWGLLAGKVVG